MNREDLRTLFRSHRPSRATQLHERAFSRDPFPSSAQSERDIEAWLDRRAQELNGEWKIVWLAGLGRARDKAAKHLALASLTPGDELRLEHELDNLYTDAAIRVSTISGAALGYLEAHVAEQVHQLQSAGELIRCFLYGITWEKSHPAVVRLALMRWSVLPSTNSQTFW